MTRVTATSRIDVVTAVKAKLGNGTSQAALSRETGLSTSVISQVLRGTYPGNTDAVVAKFAAWLEAENDKELVPIPKTPGYVKTQTGQRIQATLRYAHVAGRMVLIYGHAGNGKTMAVRHYARTNNNVWIAECRPSSKMLRSTLTLVLHAVGLKDFSGTHAADLAEAIEERISGSGGLIIMEEAQHLTDESLEELRRIQDLTGVGLALVGNETTYARLTGGQRSARFAQLFSRISKKCFVGLPTEADADALLNAWGVDDPKTRTIGIRISQRGGTLRSLCEAIQLVLMTSDDHRNVDAKSLKAAYMDLGGEAV